MGAPTKTIESGVSGEQESVAQRGLAEGCRF